MHSTCSRCSSAQKKLPVKSSICLLVAVALLALLQLISFAATSVFGNEPIRVLVKDLNATTRGRCAISLYGLPRAFESLVLPSLVKNVLEPNAKYNCDYFVHFYNLEQETGGRSGQGGIIHADEVLLLRERVLQVQHQEQVESSQQSKPSRTPTVEFTMDEESAFWKQYQPLLDKIHNTKDKWGKPLYFPWKDRSYINPTTTNNIIKMWHSIQSSWNLMQQHEEKESFKYTQVAILRSDVFYMTAIDIYDYGVEHVVIPGFGRYPVSDRIVYGPRAAVQIWAAERFARLDAHVQYMLTNHRGYGLHSERFVHYALLPAIRETLRKTTDYNKKDPIIVEHPYMCFFRARSDETVWVSDCDGKKKTTLPSIRQHFSRQGNVKTAVESVLGRQCAGQVVHLRKRIYTLKCAK